MRNWRRRLALAALCAGFLASIAFASYAVLIEPFRLKVTEYRIETPKWTQSGEIRIVLVADTHAIWPWMTPEHVERIVQSTNALEPDVVLLLGDYVATHFLGLQINPAEGVAPYRKLSAPCGVFAILGNHDLHGSEGWPEALTQTRIPVLENEARRIACGGREFWIAGLEDLWWQRADIQKTLEQVTDDAPVILMMHNPDSFPETPRSVALSVAGHTHGGQVRLPFIGPLSFVIPSRYGLRYVYGHVEEEGKALIVSGGLGATGLPMRFLNPPEIVLVTLAPEREGRSQDQSH